MLDIHQMKLALLRNTCEVTFTKVDGTERTMRCTLMTELMPQLAAGQPAEANPRKQSEITLPVWDLDKADWRAFRVDSVKTFVVVD
jgi:hypothetical protein